MLYVDDGLLAANDQEDSKAFIGKLKTEFKIVEKNASYFLGFEITQSEGGIKINQAAYTRRILEKLNFTECKPVSTPIIKESISIEQGKGNCESEINFLYRQAIGALMYLMVGTRPDIAYSFGYFSRFLENPSSQNVVGVKRY